MLVKKIALLLVLSTICYSQILRDTLFVPVTYYDFHSDRSNPEFECPHASGVRWGMVADTLDEEFKPVPGANPYLNLSVRKWFRSWLPGDFLVPNYSPSASYMQHNDSSIETGAPVAFSGFTSAEHDTAFKNRVVEDFLVFQHQGNGVYTFENDSFFPLDNRGFGNEWNNTSETSSHNHSFAMEMVWKIIMERGLCLPFRANGDLWVFVDNKLVLDLGGFHSLIEDTLKLDDLGLEEGKVYDLRVFYAQRHSSSTPSLKLSLTILVATHGDYWPQLSSSASEVKAGDSVKVEWVIMSDTGLVTDYPATFTWTITEVSWLRSVETPYLLKSGMSCTFIPEHASKKLLVKGRFENPEKGYFAKDSVYIDVLPGNPAQLVIEKSGDSTMSLHEPCPVDTVTIGVFETIQPLYAVLRDRFGNWVSLADSVNWTSEDTSIARVTKSVRSGELYNVIRMAPGGITRLFAETKGGLADTVYVKLVQVPSCTNFKMTIDTGSSPAAFLIKDSVYVNYNEELTLHEIVTDCTGRKLSEYDAVDSLRNRFSWSTNIPQNRADGPMLTLKPTHNGFVKLFYQYESHVFEQTLWIIVRPSSTVSPLSFSSASQNGASICVAGNIFRLPKSGMIIVRLFDLSGRCIADLYRGNVESGISRLKVPSLSIGSYLVRIESGGKVMQKRIFLNGR